MYTNRISIRLDVFYKYTHGTKWTETVRPHRTYRDLTRHIDETVETSEWGWAPFRTLGGKVSVWVEE
uniref:Uncharacterized protein n=1 Tax=Chlorobium phaeobacteroides (strain BS1) TaxID=331678 RepID=B3EPQ5_CHLPB